MYLKLNSLTQNNRPPTQHKSFPYPFGFCNPVWIYGRKINDDDESIHLTTVRS